MAGEQQVTGPELVASMWALPQIAQTPPIENELLVEATYDVLSRINPNLADLIEQQRIATYTAVGRLMSELNREEPTTPENREARNHAVFQLVAKMSVIGTLHAVGQALQQTDALETMFGAPAAKNAMNGESDGDVS